ncbi:MULTISPECIES: DUF6056 family protein [Vagococcus]|uniref:DUF6056 family protein n=2 Tax=Lactobacillales TaxID=186826 RepID=UPI000E4E3E71|nr:MULTISPECIES: DUF6056 family protein [Vagococcus]RHH71556.1 hypothetical protein DW196_03235 [Vagococcus sp. AM17-17]
MSKIKAIWIYGVFILILSMIVIVSWDDFFWGGNSGGQLLVNYFEGYNGRYIGNLIIIIMTRSVLLRILIYTFTNVGLAIVMSKIIGHRVKMEYIILILLTIPIGIFRQTFGWFSGFANYNISALFVLVILYLVYVHTQTWYTPIIILFLSFLGQFFVENVSMVNIVISFSAFIISLFINRDRLFSTITWLTGSVFGFYLMFQNSAYHSETSRGVSNIFIAELPKHLLQDWSELVIKDNIFLIFLFSIVIYYILNKPLLIGSYLLIFNIYFISRNYLNITFNTEPLYMLLVELVMIFLFFFILIYVGFVSLEKEDKKLYFIFLFSAVLMVAPFLMVTPFGPRNILLTYLMLSVSLGILWANLSKNIESSHVNKLNKLVKGMIICCSLFYVSLYAINAFENNRRIKLIKQADESNQSVVEIRRLPFSFLGQQLDNIPMGNRQDEYKEYYDISKNIEIKIVNRTMPLPWKQTNN